MLLKHIIAVVRVGGGGEGAWLSGVAHDAYMRNHTASCKYFATLVHGLQPRSLVSFPDPNVRKHDIGSFVRNFHIGFDPNYEVIKKTRPVCNNTPDDRIV